MATVVGVEVGVEVGVKEGVGTRVDVAVWVAGDVGRELGVKVLLDKVAEVEIVVVAVHPDNKPAVMTKRHPNNSRGYCPKDRIELEYLSSKGFIYSN